MSKKNLCRREFLGSMVGVAVAGSVFLESPAKEQSPTDKFSPIRKRVPNPFTESGKPVVVVVKGNDYPAMLAKGLALIGGFSRLGADRSVIVKPNFVFDKRTRYPTTTDTDAVLTTVQALQKEGFKDITVADRRANRKNGRAGGKFEWSGLNDKAEAGGFKTDSLLDNEAAPTAHVKDNRWKELPSVGVIKTVYDAGLIINMPTLKRHSMTNLTCSLKNMMGVLDVPTTMHMHLWRDEDKAKREAMGKEAVNRRLCLTIAEAAQAVGPELNIIDARTVLCRNHLSVASGDPREANRLILSGDPVAADVYAARVLKELDRDYELGDSKKTIAYAEELGIGIADPEGVVIKKAAV